VTPQARNRLKLIGIGSIAVLPVLASYVLYWFWTPDQYTNYGELVEPRRLPEFHLRTLEGQSFTFEQLRGRWILLVVDGGKCGPRCQEKLWQIRQVRQAQGKELGRVERVWLIADEFDPDVAVTHDYRGTWMVRVSRQEALSVVPAEDSIRVHIYLADPLGNLILRFPSNAEPKRMIKDLSRLLKYSRSG
jgi:hypothetical protein